ncbi:RagB/SusD family nutrient uptake outer membrane protein [Sphingobacterium sp. LRF_L2]|uniref:RagB/SusD family nutrient uptake outer membrane protein n=1 Tax=Sphingobacterium sp. LRF_L2 TaxID=3369421 RepID=UPI003F636194
MKAKKSIYTYFAASMLLMLGACDKEYLETAPTDEISTGTVFETTENAAMAINGIAKLMTMQHLSSQGFNGEGTIKMYYGNYPGNNFFVNLSGWAPIINATYLTNNSTIYDYYPWYYYYSLIGNANNILYYIADAEGTQVERDYIKAQALTYRAYSYTMLLQVYAARWSDSSNGTSNGVVLRTVPGNEELPLSSMAEVYAQIYADLDEALDLFESSGYVRSENYEIDENVAYAVYARAALNKQDYANAESYAKLAREGYALMSVSDYKAGFANPTSEWIWSSYGGSEETLYYYSYQAYIAYNSNASAVRNYPKCISKELYEQLPETDIRRDLFLNPDGYSNLSSSTGQATSGGDLYKHAFATWTDLYSTSLVYAYMQFKIKANDMPGVGHLNHFRSSEMYLIEAEAKYFQNKASSEVHTVLDELIKASGRDTEYSSTTTGADLLNEIKFYRQVELWGEGFDWFDMKRWGDAIDRKTWANGGNFIAALAVTIAPTANNAWKWVIPERETNYNPLATEQ